MIENDLKIDSKLIAKVQSFGFDVYMRQPDATYMIFTDGTHLGYLQVGKAGISLSTVHRTNSNIGTGFGVGERDADLTKDDLIACFITAPFWASPHHRGQVKKWRDIEQYRASSPFHAGYELVPQVPSAEAEARTLPPKEPPSDSPSCDF